MILFDRYPLTSREGAALAPVYLMQKGLNPFDLEFNPEYNNSYVFVQQYLNNLAVDIAGFALTPLRIEGHIFILFSCLLMYASFYHISRERLLSLIFSSIFYASCLYLNTAEARADAFGLFFYVLAISSSILFTNDFLRLSLLAAASLMAIYTKLYFVVPLIIVAVYELVIFSVRRLVRFVLITTAIAAVSFFLVEKLIFPGYFKLVLKPFFVFSSVTDRDYFHALRQGIVFSVLLLPLIVASLIKSRRQLFVKSPLKVILSGSRYQSFSPDYKLGNYLLFGVLSSTAGTMLFLAPHIGNQMTYLFHLMLPWYLLLLVFIFKNLNFQAAHRRSLGLSCLLLFILFLRPWNYMNARGDWAKAYSYIDANTEILASPVFADYILRENKPLYNSGHSEFVLATTDNFDNFSSYSARDSVLLKNLEPALISDTRQYYQKIKDQISSRKFDLIILDNTATIADHYTARIDQNYRKVDSANIYLPHSRHNIKAFIYKRNAIKQPDTL